MATCDNVPLASQITEFAADMTYVSTFVETDALTATTPQGKVRQTIAGALAAINADAAAVDASRVSAQAAIAVDVAAVDASRVSAQASIAADVTSVQTATEEALTVEIPAQIARLGLQYPPIAYTAGLTLDSNTKTYSYDDALYIWGGVLGTVTTGSFNETGWQPIQGDIQLRDDVEAGTSLIRDVKHIASVSALRALAGRYNGQVVELTSYYGGWSATLRGPVGGGVMVWDASSTATDDGIRIFAVAGVTTGRWVRSLDGFVTPEMAGARVDGVSSDRDAILKCLSSGIKRIVLSDIYLIDAPSGFYCLELSGTSGISIVGESPTAKIKVMDGQSAGAFNLINCSKIKFSGFEIDGNSVGASSITGVHGVRTNNINGFDFVEMTVSNTHSYGLGFQEGYAKSINIDKVSIINTGGDGIDFKDHTGTNRAIKISNLEVINHSSRQVGKPAVDVRGKATLSNIHVYQQTAGAIGIRFRESDGGITGFGSKGSTLVGFIVSGSGLAGSQGVVLADGGITVTSGSVTGVNAVGVQVIGSDSTINDVSVDGSSSCLNFDFGQLSEGGSYSNLHSTGGSTGFRINSISGTLVNCHHKGGVRGFRRSAGTGVNTLIGCTSHGASSSDFDSAFDQALSCDFETSSSVQYLTVNRVPVIRLTPNSSGVNHLNVTPGVAGSPPVLSPSGADTNCDLQLNGRGSGRVRFGARTPSADAPITGYVEIKDAAGNLRKLAVID